MPAEKLPIELVYSSGWTLITADPDVRAPGLLLAEITLPEDWNRGRCLDFAGRLANAVESLVNDIEDERKNRE